MLTKRISNVTLTSNLFDDCFFAKIKTTKMKFKFLQILNTQINLGKL